ncbi:MAG: hypothetical protein N3A66_00935, partial [Planctomycetota bacterium]|nr:hypothetical protein [Planctomycetota bacterium]
MKNIAMALVWGWVLVLVQARAAIAAEEAPAEAAAEAKPNALPDARTLLAKIRDSRYDLAEAGLSRAAAYVRAPEIQATLDPAVRSILRRTQLEAVIVPNKPIEVKTRRIPPELNAEARVGVEIYRVLLEAGLRLVTGGLDFAYNIIDPDRLLAVFDVVVDPGDKGTVEIMLQKKAQRGSETVSYTHL